jgi:hypothetical protein
VLVLAAGATAQIAAQSNISLDLIVASTDETLWFDALMNGVEYCIQANAPSALPSAAQLQGTLTAQLSVVVELTLSGDVYEGPCVFLLQDHHGAGSGGFAVSDYRGTTSGNIGTFTGTITLTLQGMPPAFSFTLVVDFTVGGIVNFQSKSTGTLNFQPGDDGGACTLSDLVSQYAFVRGAGFDLNLQLLTQGGTCSIGSIDEFGLGLQLPTLTFSNVAPVGGVVTPANTLAVLAPWLVVIGLVGCIGTIVVVAEKRRP